jgi:hypothetical protein
LSQQSKLPSVLIAQTPPSAPALTESNVPFSMKDENIPQQARVLSTLIPHPEYRPALTDRNLPWGGVDHVQMSLRSSHDAISRWTKQAMLSSCLIPHTPVGPTLIERNCPGGGSTGPAFRQQASVLSNFTAQATSVPTLTESNLPGGGTGVSSGDAAQQASVAFVLSAQAEAYQLLTLTDLKASRGGSGGALPQQVTLPGLSRAQAK